MTSAGEIDTSSTPPRANASAHASTIESTPNSRGAAVISENIGLVGVKVKEVWPWIQRDIKQARQCKADAMLQALLQRASYAPETKQPELLQKCLKAILPVCNGQISTGGVHSSAIETALKKYVRPGTEPDFYGPFIEATNIALVCLEEIEADGIRAPVSAPAVNMICQQNDMPMHQSHQTLKSIRKPDSVLLPLNSACAPFEDEKGGKKGKQKGKRKDDVKDDTKDDTRHDTKRRAHMDMNAMAKPKNLLWKDVLACIEFKRKTDSKKPIKSSPHSSHKPSKGGSSSKRKAGDPLESVATKTKITPDSDEPDVTVQMGMYAAEMFAANVAVNHLINLIVIDDVMWIWYYDRQEIIQSSGINFIQDLPRFMVLLFTLQRFELEDWGRNKDFIPVLDLLSAKAQRGEVKHLCRHDLESFMWVFIWICFCYREGVLLPEELRPFDDWARLDAVTCGEKKLSFLFHILPCPSHLEPSVWRFLVQCVVVLKKNVQCRTDLELEELLMAAGAADQSNDEELEGIDGSLLMFTNTQSWVRLSKLGNPSQ